MYHFNENNIVAGYIKELLHNFNLPTCEVFVPNFTVVYPNTNYIYNNSIIKTHQDVNISTYDDLTLYMYDFVQPYIYNKPIPNITKVLKLNSILYDTYTHEFLGNYLRFIRDFEGIDLMMLYNCFSNRLVDNLIYNAFNAEDDQYKIYAVPIKLDRKYIIGIDSDAEVEIACGLFNNNLQITSVDTGDSSITNSLYALTHKKFNQTQFNNPFEFEVSSINMANNVLIKDYENSLKLFIKLPAQNKSSISVVEVSGSVNQFKQGVDGNITNIALLPSYKGELPSKLSLFKMNDSISYPFADRLLEYLFGQAITPNEQIGENIERVQKQLLSPTQYYRNGVRLRHVGYYGVWDNEIRNTVYKALSIKKNKSVVNTEKIVNIPLNQSADFNDDGVVDMDDAYYLLYHIEFGAEDYPLLNEFPPTVVQGDLNGDGVVDEDDVLYLQNYLSAPSYTELNAVKTAASSFIYDITGYIDKDVESLITVVEE